MRWLPLLVVVGGCFPDLGFVRAAERRREAQCHPTITRTFADPVETLRAEQRIRPYPIRPTSTNASPDGTYRVEWVMEHAGERLRGVQVHRPDPKGGYELCRAAENTEAAFACALRVCLRSHLPAPPGRRR